MTRLTAFEIEERLKIMRINKDPLLQSFENAKFIQSPSVLKVKEICREWEADNTFTIVLNNGEVISGMKSKEETVQCLRKLPINNVEDIISVFKEYAE